MKIEEKHEITGLVRPGDEETNKMRKNTRGTLSFLQTKAFFQNQNDDFTKRKNGKTDIYCGKPLILLPTLMPFMLNQF